MITTTTIWTKSENASITAYDTTIQCAEKSPLPEASGTVQGWG